MSRCCIPVAVFASYSLGAGFFPIVLPELPVHTFTFLSSCRLCSHVCLLYRNVVPGNQHQLSHRTRPFASTLISIRMFSDWALNEIVLSARTVRWPFGFASRLVLSDSPSLAKLFSTAIVFTVAPDLHSRYPLPQPHLYVSSCWYTVSSNCQSAFRPPRTPVGGSCIAHGLLCCRSLFDRQIYSFDPFFDAFFLSTTPSLLRSLCKSDDDCWFSPPAIRCVLRIFSAIGPRHRLGILLFWPPE